MEKVSMNFHKRYQNVARNKRYTKRYTLPINVFGTFPTVISAAARGAKIHTARMNREIIVSCKRCYRIANYSQNHPDAR